MATDTLAAPADAAEEVPPDLVKIRGFVSKWLVGLIWVYTVACPGLAYIYDRDIIFVTVSGVILAVVATAAWWNDPVGLRTRLTVTLALVSQVSVHIYAMNGKADSAGLDAYMFYFVINFFVLSYFCWRSMLALGIFAVVHHTSLTFLLPLAVWPTADLLSGLTHLFWHALAAAGTLVSGIWLARRVFRMFSESHAALLRAALLRVQRAQAETERMAQRQQELEAMAAETKRKTMNDLANSFEASVKDIVVSVSTSARSMHQSAEGMTQAAEGTSRRTRTAAAVSEQASANTSTVSAAADQLAASISEITRQAER